MDWAGGCGGAPPCSEGHATRHLEQHRRSARARPGRTPPQGARSVKRGAPTRVFVYGTLLAGEPNHRLLSGARLVTEACTKPAFELRDLGAFPGLMRGDAHAVAGEVHEVDEPRLTALDRLEGRPRFSKRPTAG